MNEFEEAIDRVSMGPERKSRVMSEHEKKVTAFHEGGHTILAHLMEHHDPPHKVTIVARGMAGGYTKFLPDEETHYRTRRMFRDQLAVALGGHAAEELIFGEASTGPSNDIEQATRIARAMVTRWGMSDNLGPRTFGKTDEMIFLGREITETRNYSEKIAEQIDEEVRALIQEAQERARTSLRENEALLTRLATVLLEVETLEGDPLTRLLNSDPNEPWPPSDMQSKEPPKPSEPESPGTEERPSFETPRKPGLAWEGGGTSHIDPNPGAS